MMAECTCGGNGICLTCVLARFDNERNNLDPNRPRMIEDADDQPTQTSSTQRSREET